MKNNSVAIGLGIIIVVFFCLPSNAFFHINDIVPVFPDAEAAEIEDAVIEGASFFFKANAEIMTLYSHCERNYGSYLDYPNCLSSVNSALDYFTNSKEKYKRAVSIGSAAVCKSEKTGLLKNFDYDGFAIKKGLNKDAMGKVKGYLVKADVTGIYQKAADDTGKIIEMLDLIKKDLAKGIKPEITDFWTLLQSISKLMMFGNYSTVAAQYAFGNYE
jgi:hypothetical protein